MIEINNALKFITMLFSIQKILRLNLGVAYLKFVSIYNNHNNNLPQSLVLLFIQNSLS